MKRKLTSLRGRLWVALSVGLPALLPLTPAQATVAPPEFNRYEVILSRRPFGAAPAEEEPRRQEDVPPAPPPEFAANLKMCAITESGGRLRVGFTVAGAKSAGSHFLFVGESSEDGYEVMRADYEAETAVVRKDGQEVEIKMGGGGGKPQLAAVGPDVARPAGMRTRLAAPSVVGRKSATRVLSPGRQARLEEEQRRAETLPELHGQVLEKHLQEYNMQAIREGAPALPIALTPEQDAQLVAEGVLPPAE